MKIETAILDEFLTHARMGEVETCLLNFTEKGLEICTMSVANTHSVNALLKASAFKEYAAIGNVGVDELSKLIKIFKRLGKELEFEVEGNLLTAKGGKKELRFELVDEKFIEEKGKMPELELTTSFKIDGKIVLGFLTDAKMNTDTSIIFETVENGVKVTNTGKYKFTHNIDSEGTKGGVKVKFGQPLLESLGAIKDGEVIFKVKDEYPVVIEYNKEHFEIKMAVAPQVETDIKE